MGKRMKTRIEVTDNEEELAKRQLTNSKQQRDCAVQNIRDIKLRGGYRLVVN